MKRIHQLPPDVVTKIAAGEVIERPASVVKELLENSVDAGATRIDIDLDAGGTELIRVVDDGHGIAADDLPLAFASARHQQARERRRPVRHRHDGLPRRGARVHRRRRQGHAAIAAARPDQRRGAALRRRRLSPIKPWNGSPGTRIEVRHLFFNVPVRKKFLKSIATELGHVCEIGHAARARQPRACTSRCGTTASSSTTSPRRPGLLDRIALFFGGEVRDALYEIDTGPGPMRLTGFIADPKCDRGNAKLQYLFVNGRWFRDRSIAHAMQEAFRGLLMTGRYAVGFLFLTVAARQGRCERPPDQGRGAVPGELAGLLAGPRAVKTRLLKENLVPG